MRDIKDLIDTIRQVERDIGCNKKRSVWYRGLPTGRYSLVPSLFRKQPNRKIRLEGNIFAEFNRGCPRIVVEHCKNSWDILTAMQHYGVPTRLLDWTEDLFVALYFAIYPGGKKSLNLNSNKEEDWPCVWLLNPFMLNKIAVNDNSIFDSSDKIPFEYYEVVGPGFKNGGEWPFKLPIAYMPSFSNDRIKAQKGCFTCHGSDVRPIEGIMSEQKGEFWHLNCVYIRPHLVKEIREYLFSSKANHYDIYPDIHGFQLQLRDKFKI